MHGVRAPPRRGSNGGAIGPKANGHATDGTHVTGKCPSLDNFVGSSEGVAMTSAPGACDADHSNALGWAAI